MGKRDTVPKRTPESMKKMLKKNKQKVTGEWSKDLQTARKLLGMKETPWPN